MNHPYQYQQQLQQLGVQQGQFPQPYPAGGQVLLGMPNSQHFSQQHMYIPHGMAYGQSLPPQHMQYMPGHQIPHYLHQHQTEYQSAPQYQQAPEYQPSAATPWGRGRGRGRGNPVVGALVAKFANPNSQTKYDECDPEHVEGLWGIEAAASGSTTGEEKGAQAPQEGKAGPSVQAGGPAQVNGTEVANGESAAQHSAAAGGDESPLAASASRHDKDPSCSVGASQSVQGEVAVIAGHEDADRVSKKARRSQHDHQIDQQAQQQLEQQQIWEDQQQQGQQQQVQEDQQQEGQQDQEQQQEQKQGGQQQQEEPMARTEEGLEACRARRSLPILLFDLNGTLTSHTSQRQAAGTNLARPYAALLARLAKKFRLGIYTSSTVRTVAAAKEMLEAAAGCPLFEPRLILYREHTAPAPAQHRENGGKEWDTIKPLKKWFAKMDRVLLFDDDAYKAVAGEEDNMVVVPAWGGNGTEEDPGCRVLEALVMAVEEELGGLEVGADVRAAVAPIQKRLVAAAQARGKELKQQQQSIVVPEDSNAIDLDL